jgi:hypothetical protein
LAIVTNVGAGCGGRGSVGRANVIAGRFPVSGHSALTNGADAYGEVVWSCSPVLFSFSKERKKRLETKGFGDIG